MKWTEVLLVNPATGEQQSHGCVMEKRNLGRLQLTLTFDEARDFWWIIIEGASKIRTLGYHSSREETCWHVFYECDEKEVEELFTTVLPS